MSEPEDRGVESPARGEGRPLAPLTAEDVEAIWPLLAPDDRAHALRSIPRERAEDFFFQLPSIEQAGVVLALPADERRSWVRLLPPDDAADLVQAAPAAEREGLLRLLDDTTRQEVNALLAYAEDEAGGLMNPRFARVRPDMTVDEALAYVRKQARTSVPTIQSIYVLDEAQRLLGVVRLRALLTASPDRRVRDVMNPDPVFVTENQDQEVVSKLFAQHDLMALPVVDAERRMKGIVTVDDIVDVVEEEATEDIQKIGGTAALDAPYLAIGLPRMVRKRGGWLAALFVGEMLTATAMAYFEEEIARAVVLALFVPLVISSGGNAGSQASTLVIRAMALGEVTLRDWWRVLRREIAAGLALGGLLGAIGFLRIVLWQVVRPIYGPHWLLVATTVFTSLVGVVAFGTLAGALLPFVLRRLGFDPASASAPFVATVVDVTGLVIYFSVAAVVLRGTLL